MSFTPNTRDEVTLIHLKHRYDHYTTLTKDDDATDTALQIAEVELQSIRATFAEVRERNALGKQPGSYEAIGTICDEFFAAAEPAQVG